jgi:putative membrane protein
MNFVRKAAPLAAALTLLCALPLTAASDTDSTFVGKVSQGGMYEVIASQYAESHAHAQNVKDLAVMEVHDHTLVNRRLMQIAQGAGIHVATTLNPEFQQRLDKLKAVPKDQFDQAYLADMKQIHDNDQKLFAQEANDGTGAFKPFAAETDIIVKRHIGALNAD